MNKRRQAALRRAGWTVGDASQFLGLSDEEALLIEMKLALAHSLRARRESLGLTQQAVATRLRSSQSRVAKMEAGDATVSIDLLVKSLLALGATRRDVGRIIGRRAAGSAA